ncbi:unnamed protein product [Miscanthus lutarioriparius]|uniref:Uncharacterized protein n=1 Tax=Miscanthus lutarioriparius TaxID=422564 RepID=A0A811QBV5_9POAL|nr:unnamed protein product [Miscanthus lutarioriparius]
MDLKLHTFNWLCEASDHRELLLARDGFESCKIQVFCIAEEGTEAEELKADVKKYLYDLRMQAEDRIRAYLSLIKETAQREGRPLMEDGRQIVVNEEKVEKFLYMMLKLNTTIVKYSI